MACRGMGTVNHFCHISFGFAAAPQRHCPMRGGHIRVTSGCHFHCVSKCFVEMKMEHVASNPKCPRPLFLAKLIVSLPLLNLGRFGKQLARFISVAFFHASLAPVET